MDRWTNGQTDSQTEAQTEKYRLFDRTDFELKLLKAFLNFSILKLN